MEINLIIFTKYGNWRFIVNRYKLLISFSDEEYGEALAKAFLLQEIGAEITVGDYDRIHSFDGFVITDKTDVLLSDKVKIFEAYTSFSEVNEVVVNSFQITVKNHSNHSKSDTRIITVMGCEGGAGVTSISKALGKEMSLYYDKKTCIISFSLFPDVCVEDNSSSFRKLLYRLTDDTCFNSGDREIVPSSFFIKTDDEYYTPYYGEGINPLCLCEEEIHDKLLKWMIDSELFDVIIIDLPKEKVFDNKSVLSYADNILLVKNARSNYMDFSKMINMINKIINKESKEITVIVNDVSGHENENGSERIEVEKVHNNVSSDDKLISIDYDPESFQEGRIHIDGSFGIGIKNIAFNALFC
ncbi:MAG: hypothetical protein E7225_02530 [Clostridiales bacterium]|nr:hypothetical protein [Clostridiales bacterium]